MGAVSRDTLAAGTSARYVALPAAGTAGGPAADGAALDAGTAMLISNNWNHLRNESLRTLVADHWGQVVEAGHNNWVGLNEPTPPDDYLAEERYDIDWSRSNSAVYGPFPVIRDAVGLAPGTDAAPRRLKAAVYARTGATALSVYVAVTATGQTPDRGYLGFAKLTTTSSTLELLTATFDVGAGATTLRTCAPPADADVGALPVEEVYVWVGFRLPSGVGTLASVTVYEVNP